MNFSLSPFAPENLVSRDGFGSPVQRQPAHVHHTQAESGHAVMLYNASTRGREGWGGDDGNMSSAYEGDI